MFADLHIHSSYSDGSQTPTELIQLAASRGVSAMALSDHDMTTGTKELADAGKQLGILTVPAVEISTAISGMHVHILGYFIDTNNAQLQSFITGLGKARTETTKGLVSFLNEHGVLSLLWEQILQHNQGQDWITGVQVYRAAIANNNITKHDSFFSFINSLEQYLLNENSPGYSDIRGYPPEDAIDAIKAAGGIAVIAHPKLIGDDNEVIRLIKYGAMGIEVNYPAHSGQETRKYLQIAERYQLAITGGSDWHGSYTQRKVTLGDFGLTAEGFDRFCKLRN